MTTAYKEVLCLTCKGTCEVEGVPGEYGYEPVYEECPTCKGEGYIEFYPDVVYNSDRM